MNALEVKKLAQPGATMTHDTKGGLYRIKGQCLVQVMGLWREGICYSPAHAGTLFVRLLDDCRKLSPAEDVVPQRRVVCAAIRAADGDVLTGVRHYSPDMASQIQARTDGEKFKFRSGEDQGFVDQFGDYLTREQAWLVAVAAGQIVRTLPLEGKLYSEHLY